MSALAPFRLASVAVLAVACGSSDPAANAPDAADSAATHDYVVTTVVTGLEHPWGMAFLPGGDILVTERPGRVRLVRDGALRPSPVTGGPAVHRQGQGGLLDIALHPNFPDNRLVYLTYSKAVPGGATTAVARARWDGESLAGLEDIFVADAVGGGQHFGSRLLFDRDGHLFITVGDRGRMGPAQDLSDHVGTTLRLRDDGTVPGGNPFIGREGARPEIYSFGHRNAQGMALHPGTGEVWQNEHGPRGGDEINRIQAGGNYGWPDNSFGDHYDGRPIPDPQPGDGTVLPLLHWIPAIAPAGMTFYTGDRFPNWRGSVFNGSLVDRHLRRVVFDGTQPVHQEELLRDYGERIRDVEEGPDGSLYILTDSVDGVLARLEPAAP